MGLYFGYLLSDKGDQLWTILNLRNCYKYVQKKLDLSITKNYYYENEKIIIVINIQKSNYDNSYYINYGFWVRVIHDNVDYPKITDSDIARRFIVPDKLSKTVKSRSF